MKYALSVEHVSKTYSNGKKALEDLNFDLSYGQLVGLIGPNGAGKSTLIHIMVGVLAPTKGQVTLHVDNGRNIAWVSQFSSIDWYLSALDNVRLGARLGGYGFNEAEIISKECLSKVGLQHKMKDNPESLSGGEQRRLQVARAFAQNSKVLILDEPTTGLDPVASDNLMKELRGIADSGCLVIVSGHDLSLMETLADHILFVSGGQLKINDEKTNVMNKTNNGLKDLYSIHK